MHRKRNKKEDKKSGRGVCRRKGVTGDDDMDYDKNCKCKACRYTFV